MGSFQCPRHQGVRRSGFPEAFSNPVFEVIAIDAERTFWEKATILHQEAHRPGAIPARYSRHYYDLYKLSESPIRRAALANLTLLKSVVEFKERFYYTSWARYDLAIPGSFRLSPPDSQPPRSNGTTLPCAICSTENLQHLERFWPDWQHWNGKSTLKKEPASVDPPLSTVPSQPQQVSL
jgi:hypothetical protein